MTEPEGPNYDKVDSYLGATKILHTDNWDIVVENGQYTVAIPCNSKNTESVDISGPGHEEIKTEANIAFLEDIFSWPE